MHAIFFNPSFNHLFVTFLPIQLQFSGFEEIKANTGYFVCIQQCWRRISIVIPWVLLTLNRNKSVCLKGILLAYLDIFMKVPGLKQIIAIISKAKNSNVIKVESSLALGKE